MAEVMAANDIPVYLCDRAAPTPVVGYAILTQKAAGSVVITSSHNPAIYSGFKVRTEYAGAAPPPVLDRIEALIPQALSQGVARIPLADAQGRNLVRMFDPRPAYLAHLSELVDLDGLRAADLRVLVDPMYGAGAGYLRELLSGGKTKVWEIRAAHNPLFPGMHNPEPIPRNLAATRRAVRRHGAQVGLITDGDADRIGVVDGQGRFVNQLQTFALLAYHLLEMRGLRGPIVKSVTTTSMVSRLGELYDVPVFETGVGFKYLGPKMRETDALIAGEESGGFAFRGHLPERDGILSALYLLELMAGRGKEPQGLIEELFEKVGAHYYDRIDTVMEKGERRPGSGEARGAGAHAHRRPRSHRVRPHGRAAVSVGGRGLGPHSAVRHGALDARLHGGAARGAGATSAGRLPRDSEGVTAEILDDFQAQRKLDPQGMREAIKGLPQQCRQAWEAAPIPDTAARLLADRPRRGAGNGELSHRRGDAAGPPATGGHDAGAQRPPV